MPVSYKPPSYPGRDYQGSIEKEIVVETTPEEELLKIKAKLLDLNKRYFANSDTLAREITRLIEASRDVLKRPATAMLREGEIQLVILTSRSFRNPPKRFYVKALDNRVKSIVTGTPEAYIVRAGVWRLKCGCKYSEVSSTRAWKRLLKYAREEKIRGVPAENLFSRYTLCKHTIVALSIGLANKVLTLDGELENTLRIGLFAIYLANNEKPEKSIVEANLRLLASRHKLSLKRATGRRYRST